MRRLLYIGFVVLYGFSVSTAKAQERSEECRTKIYFATFLKISDTTQPTDRFSSQFSEKLSIGYVVIDLCDSPGARISTFQVFDNSDEARRQIAVAYKNVITISAFVHGIETLPDAALLRGADLARKSGAALPLFVFIWPSDHGGVLASLGWCSDNKRIMARQTGLFFRWLLALAHEAGANVDLYSHSQGGEWTSFALDEAETWGTEQRLLRLITNVVMAAPNISQSDYREIFSRLVKHLAFRVTIYCSRKDRAFAAKDYTFGTDTIGGSCPANDLGQNIEYVDVSFVINSRWDDRFFHSYFFSNPFIQQDARYAVGLRDISTSKRSPCTSQAGMRCFVLRK